MQHDSFMALPKRPFPDDHGLSKKFDSPRMQSQSTNPVHVSWVGIRRRRFLLGILVIFGIYLFVKNIPTDVPPVSQRYSSTLGNLASGHTKAQLGATPPNLESSQHVQTGSFYDGPIRFPNLATSLRAFVTHPQRDNVVFTVLHASSASRILPLACQMRQYRWNSVHIVLLGRNEVTPEGALKVNGVTEAECPVVWHDARPDHAMASRDERIWKSIQLGFAFINQAINPQVVLVDDMSQTDATLAIKMEEIVARHNKPLIALPTHAQQDMSWITMLESESLKYFHDVQVDIVIQPYSSSAGSLVKLLRSLQKAHYKGLPLPRLTIELPSDSHPFVKKYVQNFRWPPKSTGRDSKLSIRRRIDLKHISAAEAALRTVELFYPVDPYRSHVLILNPDVEVAPSFFHYLMFTILSYKYGKRSNLESRNLVGISLNFPQKNLDGSTPFITPSSQSTEPFVIGQSANSNAALYFGDQWAELHSFLSQRLLLDPSLKKSKMKADPTISKRYPQWVTHAQEMMQARGLYMLFPAFSETEKDHIAVLHPELHNKPEEFADLEDEAPAPIKAPDASFFKDKTILLGDSEAEGVMTDPPVNEGKFTLPSFMSGNPNTLEDGRLPTLSEMKLLSPKGDLITWEELSEATISYAENFAKHFGGCSSAKAKETGLNAPIENLFCEAT